MMRLDDVLHGSPYQGYAYAYPHKSAYRPFDPPVPLRSLWAEEPRGALFLYVHVPFCEMRCGFCNLFTRSNPAIGITNRYLATLRREALVVRDALGAEARFARLAFGGGTPTFLEPDELASLFDLVDEFQGTRCTGIPISMETSPATADADRLAVLRQQGVTRVSLGVQSFVENEVRAAGRPQRTTEVETALNRLREAGFPTINIDLIYGLPGQTLDSWLSSVRLALSWRPEELYLYPLYVRPLTGLGGSARSWDDRRLACYRAARDLLLAEGYEQVSMRMFRASHAPTEDGIAYCCQTDGMLGLGCGARSYTRCLHYSREFAVGARAVSAILADYLDQPAEAFAVARHGHRLAPDDCRRRFVLQSLLQRVGLDQAAYRRRFGSRPLDDLPELTALLEEDLVAEIDEHLCLTEAGLERSDAVGPWLYSPRVRKLMEECIVQ